MLTTWFPFSVSAKQPFFKICGPHGKGDELTYMLMDERKMSVVAVTSVDWW